MQSDTSPFGLRGFLIDAPEFGTLRSRPNGAVIIDNGRISEIGDYDDLRRLRPNSIRWIDRRGAAIYEDSCEVGFEAAKQSGIRAILGKMMMDLGSYGQLQPKKVLSISLLESERLCRKWHRAEEGRLEYAFSPRFAVTCSEKMMRGAAELAARLEAYLQTHLAENREELEKVHHLYMSARDYTHVYETCGMLTARTMLG